MEFPFKYIQMNDGYQALVWALDQPLRVSKNVELRLVEQGVVAVAGEVGLPIYEEMLEELFKSPCILVSFLTNSFIDDRHILVELDLPQIYEMKGILSVLKQKETMSPAA